MYLEDPKPLVDSLCELAAPGAVVSIVAKNVEVMALRLRFDSATCDQLRQVVDPIAAGVDAESVDLPVTVKRGDGRRPVTFVGTSPGTACASSPTGGRETGMSPIQRSWSFRQS